MSTFIQHLLSRQNRFTIDLQNANSVHFPAWIENELINNPAVTASIETISYHAIKSAFRSMSACFQVTYSNSNTNEPVFLCKDLFEIVSAISVALRAHLNITSIVLDNRSGSFDTDSIFQLINTVEEFVGEELQIHQNRSTRAIKRSYFNGRIVVLKIERSFFDTANDINTLSCILAEIAASIKSKSHMNEISILNEILIWLRKNVVYENTNRLSDHSAVGLIKNGTAVCQGIAAYSYLLLSYCGINARYVSGEGVGINGWGAHGWNMVFIHGKWRHIDYTFQLNQSSELVLQDEADFQRKHRWDRVKYSSERSNVIINSKKTLRKSIITFLPDKPCFSINGCVVDMSNSYKPCIVHNKSILVSITSLITVFDGCYTIKDNGLCVYYGGKKYLIQTAQLFYINSIWYTNIAVLESIGFEINVYNNTICVRKRVYHFFE